MRGGFLFAVAGLLSAQAPPDPTEVLMHARERFIASQPRLPNYICVQTVDRTYFKRAKQPYPFPSCAEMRAARDARAEKLNLLLTDRLRLDVKVSGSLEIGSWAGASQFDEKSIFDLVGRGPFSTGAMGNILADILAGAGTSFAYSGQVLSNAGELYQYNFQVPLAASHYLMKAGDAWQAVPFEGDIGIDPHSFDLRHLVVRASNLPQETQACESISSVDYAMVRFSRGDYLLPQQSRFHVLMANTQEDDVTTVYTGCREYQSESSIRFEEYPAGATPAKVGSVTPANLPAGLPISLVLAAPIDTGVAAAGDVILEKVRKPVRAKGSKQVLIPAGATVRARIVRMQHWMLDPKSFDISIRLETWEAAGVSTPLYAEPDRSTTEVNVPVPIRQARIDLPPEAQSQRVRTYIITTDRKRTILPRGFESKWITTTAPKQP